MLKEAKKKQTEPSLSFSKAETGFNKIIIKPEYSKEQFEELDQIVKDKLKSGQLKSWDFHWSNFERLKYDVSLYLKIPSFRDTIVPMLEEKIKLAHSLIFDNAVSMRLKVIQFRQIFFHDLTMDAIMSTYSIAPKKITDFRPFGGSEFYFNMKEAFYENEFTDLFILKALTEVMSQEKAKVIRDPELPILKGIKPESVTVHINDNESLMLEVGEKTFTVNIKNQLGLQGTKGFCSKKSKEGNKNWDILQDVFVHPSHFLDMNGSGYMAFPTGMNKRERDKSSKSISKLENALNLVIELEDGSEWFRKDKTVYIPNFGVGNSYLKCVEDLKATVGATVEALMTPEDTYDEFNGSENRVDEYNDMVDEYNDMKDGYDLDFQS